MNRAMERFLVAWILFSTGCSTLIPRYTQFPTIRAQPVDSEVKSYTWHDPFPDEEAGPKTYTRPLIFAEPRSETLKDYFWSKKKAAYGYPQTYSPWGSPLWGAPNSYPVQPIWAQQPPGITF